MQISCIPFSAASCIQQLTYLTNHNLQNKIHRHIFVLKMVQLSDQSSAYLCSYKLLKLSPFEIDTIHKSQNSIIDHGSFFIRGSPLLLLLKLFEDFLFVLPSLSFPVLCSSFTFFQRLLSPGTFFGVSRALVQVTTVLHENIVSIQYLWSILFQSSVVFRLTSLSNHHHTEEKWVKKEICLCRFKAN